MYERNNRISEYLKKIDEKLDYLVVPLGGGGLISGSALSCQYWSPNTKVIGAEPISKGDGFKSFNSK